MALLLILIIGFVMANPFLNTLGNQLVPQAQDAVLFVAKNHLNDSMTNEKLNNINKMTGNTNTTNLKHINDYLTENSHLVMHDESTKKTTQRRKHKAMFVDYPLEPRISQYSKIPNVFEANYDNSEITAKDKLKESKKYQESDIFYIRLPPTPYMFVPGLGYVSQPPTYSTTVLKPQLALVPQLFQLSHMKQPVQPAKLQSTLQQTANNPLIKLPVDFVSNGKPTSVYQWQKKSNKKPVDSPIMNLNNLSTDFVSNGKPTSIYQWQANLKPIRRPDDSFNSFNLGSYAFNGKLTSMYLLRPDGSSSMHQSIKNPDYQDDFKNVLGVQMNNPNFFKWLRN